jgi:hypothetical protein
MTSEANNSIFLPPSTRTGKIARLPYHLREQLCHRLLDGESGPSLLEWLNAEPEVQAVLAKDFAGRPINEQNLSAWRQGGFVDWQRYVEDRAFMQHNTEIADAIEAQTDGGSLSDQAVTLAFLNMIRLIRETPPDATLKEKCQVAVSVAQQAARLKNAETAADRASLAREKWETPRQEAAEEKSKELTQEEKVARLQQIFAVL